MDTETKITSFFRCKTKKINEETNTLEKGWPLNSESLNNSKLGWHISKQGKYLNSLKIFNEIINGKWINCPVQIFTGSTKMWRRAVIDEKDIELSNQYIKENSINLFIHSIYLINLCRIGSEFNKAYDALLYDLKLGEKIGALGVVVHVGKCLKMGKETGTNNMIKNILSILNEIDGSCPLLLETPAGEGTELLVTFEEFDEFYNKFHDIHKKKFKICIDTCHVFASGYDPEDYLIRWNNKNPGSISLVHFNDSKCECGSKKDRHAAFGKGYIGAEKLNRIENWCANLDIPMVREW